MAAVVVSAWLVEAKQSVIENMAPVLTRVFTPLFAATLLAFLVAIIWTNNGIDVERDVLILFDLLLVVVLGLLLYAISARDPAARPGLFDRLQLALVVSALIIDVLVLVAITGRITEWGFTPNKTAALGENVILLTNLAWSAWLFLGFVRGRMPFARLEHWQTRYLDRVRRLGLDRRPRLPARVRLRLSRIRIRSSLPRRAPHRCARRSSSRPPPGSLEPVTIESASGALIRRDEVEVAVLGAGNGGCAVAFDWAQHGHNVRLFATAEYPGEVAAIAERGEIVSTGELSGAAPISYAGHDAGRTVSGADLIMVVGPAYATDAFALAAAQHLTPEQAIVVCPTSCLGSFAFRRAAGLSHDDERYLVGETSTLPYAVRMNGPATIHVL